MSRFHLSCVVGLSYLKRTSTHASPFSLVYEPEMMIFIVAMAASSRFVLVSKISDTRDCINDIEVLEEKRRNMKNKWLIIKDRLARPTTSE